MPIRPRQRRSLVLVAATVVLAAGCSASAPSPHVFGEGLSSPVYATVEPAIPGGPEAFAGDPRLGQCFGTPDAMEFVFEMTHGRDYQSYLPAMLLSPELDIENAVLVVVYRESFKEPPTTGFRTAGPDATPQPNHRFVCAVVPEMGPVLYADVDITGLTVAVTPSSPGPSRAIETAEPPPSGPTPTPAPAWYPGADVLLECEYGQGSFGRGWQPGDLDTSPMSSAERALGNLLDRVSATASPFPYLGFRLAASTPEGAAYTYTADGAVRAAVVLRSDATDGFGPWRVNSVAACEPGELGPDLMAGATAGIWRDANGAVVPSTAVSETADCYFSRQLRVDGRLFVWDPFFGPSQNFDPAQLDSAIGRINALPGGARDTGYESSGRRLFVAGDGTAAYLVRDDGIEQWAHVKGDEYQRTDCN